MKKKILDFSKVHYYTPTRNGIAREMRTRHNRGACFKSAGDGDDDEDDDEGEKNEAVKLTKKIETRVKKLLEGRASKEDVANIAKQLTFLTRGKNEKGEDIDDPFPIEALREMANPKTGLLQKLTDMGLKVQELESRTTKIVKDMSIRGQVEAWLESKPKEMGGTRSVKEIVQNIKNGVKESLPALTLDLRVASPMHVSTVNAGASPYIGKVEVEAGVNDFLRFPNTFWDFIKKGRTGAETYVWVNKTNPLGAAAFIGPGVAKPGVSFELAAENSHAKKIADSLKAGTELLQDIDGMVSFIEDEVREQIRIKLNTTLWSGVNSSTVPAGITTLAQLFSYYTSAAGLSVQDPNRMDALRSIVAALRSGKLTGEITLFMNEIDIANMEMTKNEHGSYVLPPFTTADNRKIAGATIVGINDTDLLPVGSVLGAFLRYYRILIYKDMTLNWGWENDDFTKNLVTVIAEMRLHQFVNTIHTGFALYDTFANIINAIKAVPAP